MKPTHYLLLVFFALPLFAQHDHDHGDSGHEGHAHAHSEPEPELDDHSGHDHGDGEHEEEGHGHAEGALHVDAAQQKRFDIRVAPATGGRLAATVTFPGEVTYNEDRLVHMVPRVGGVVRDVTVSVGDKVEEGQILGVIESRELADAKSDLLESEAHLELARTRLEREQRLREKEINSVEELLEAEEAFTRVNIARRRSRQKLLALGLGERDVEDLTDKEDASITRYPLKAPLSGTVVERHLTRGEFVNAGADVLTVADLATVWVEAAVSIPQLDQVKAGQTVIVTEPRSGRTVEGELILVTPFVNRENRTATARIRVSNLDGTWPPGLFVDVQPPAQGDAATVVVPVDALQRIEGEDVVFVPEGDAFTTVEVQTGRRDGQQVEILKGLKLGQEVVVSGAFHLKAILITADMDPHAGHGH